MTDPASILLFYICIFFEANTEPIDAKEAVAHVIMKRADWDPENIVDVVMKPRQFSWTLEHGKLKEAITIMRTGVLPKRMHPIRKIAYKWLLKPTKEPVWTHYQVNTLASPTWTCYREGVTTHIFEGSHHVFCGDKDVVKPGGTPRYIIKRRLRRFWRELRSENYKNDC